MLVCVYFFFCSKCTLKCFALRIESTKRNTKIIIILSFKIFASQLLLKCSYQCLRKQQHRNLFYNQGLQKLFFLNLRGHGAQRLHHPNYYYAGLFSLSVFFSSVLVIFNFSSLNLLKFTSIILWHKPGSYLENKKIMKYYGSTIMEV